jgi:hypothetical protein
MPYQSTLLIQHASSNLSNASSLLLHQSVGNSNPGTAKDRYYTKFDVAVEVPF